MHHRCFRQGDLVSDRSAPTNPTVAVPSPGPAPGPDVVPLFDVVANCITVRGSFVGTRRDMAEAIAFAAEGRVKADIELQPLSSINSAHCNRVSSPRRPAGISAAGQAARR
jgi:D-arabinose 1-dehydrogenase-like Zn-dependent alcohol dehydrogenase